MSKIINWLKYYRASLIDGTRGERHNSILKFELDKEHFHELPEDCVRKLWKKKHLEKLSISRDKHHVLLKEKDKNSTTHYKGLESLAGFERKMQVKGQGNITLDFIKIAIAPIYKTSEIVHGWAKGESKIYYPYWVPAYMSKEGLLMPPQNKETPYFLRKYLSPQPSGLPTICSIDYLDEKLENRVFNDFSWEQYWEDSAYFFKEVANETYTSCQKGAKIKIAVDYYDNNNDAIKHILNLYNSLIEKKEILNETYPLLAHSLQESEELNFKALSEQEIYLDRLHLGQMNNQFPLSDSQREAFAKFFFSMDSKSFAINGPPGTGKTTMLQSIIANLIVHAVLNKEQPPLIVGSSTNNQAITNILDGMELKEEKEKMGCLSKRWLPGLSSFGMYWASVSKGRQDEKKYPYACQKSLKDGFIADFEKLERFSEYVKYYLENLFTCRHTNKSLVVGENPLLEIKEHLFEIIKNKKILLDDAIAIGTSLSNVRKELTDQKFEDIADLEKNINEDYARIAEININIEEIELLEKELAKRRKSAIIELTAYFRPNLKARIEQRYKRILHPILNQIAPSDKLFRSNYLKGELDRMILALLDQKKELTRALEDKVSLFERLSHAFNQYEKFIHSWEEAYSDTWNALLKNTKGEYVNRNEIQSLGIRLDLSYRYELFWLCVHYREVEYLLEFKEIDREKKEREFISGKDKLHRLAKLTPLFISTFHSLPKFSTYFSRESIKEFYYENLFDLLIVDEAGQVSPEVALPSLTLAKRILAVGDTKQIEPVWNIGEKIDYFNALKFRLCRREEHFDKLKEMGFCASSGSIMQIVKKSSPYSFVHEGGEEEKGVYLLEHRRCLDPIIEYSNRFIYKNSLKLKVGSKHGKKHTFPPLGYLHVSGFTEKVGSSRKNELEAKAIIAWLERNKNELEIAYTKSDQKKPLREIIAIITPFSAQKILLQKLLKEKLASEAKGLVIGTVHALQGAERPIILFSPVYDLNAKQYFFDAGGKHNMLNVALTRAKHSFLVFGEMGIFNPNLGTPSGNLAKLLFKYRKGEEAEDLYRLDNSFLFGDDGIYTELKKLSIDRIDSLRKHDLILNKSILKARRELIIFSPFISIKAILPHLVEEEGKKSVHIDILSEINKSIKTGKRIIIVTDQSYDYNKKTNSLKSYSQKGREALEKAGAILIEKNVHNKTICIDDKILIEGSFNWLSAARDKNAKNHKENASFVVQGEEVKDWIDDIKRSFNLEHEVGKLT